jgi:hypothetical protein
MWRPPFQELSAKPGKDSGQGVRARRQELGMPVASAGQILPLQASALPLDPQEALAALDADPPEAAHERAVWRMRLAERRMREVYLSLEEAEQRDAPQPELERLADEFAHESAVYGAAVAACGPDPSP